MTTRLVRAFEVAHDTDELVAAGLRAVDHRLRAVRRNSITELVAADLHLGEVGRNVDGRARTPPRGTRPRGARGAGRGARDAANIDGPAGRAATGRPATGCAAAGCAGVRRAAPGRRGIER